MRELMLLRVGDLAAENCAHLMWCTGPFMLEGIRLLRAWGFRYRNIAFTWIKTNRVNGKLFTGMGHYTRSNAEYVLLGIKGRMKRESTTVHSVLMAPMIKHSAKPRKIRERIERLFGDVPRLEIFARTKCAGWDQTGLELDGMDVRAYIEKMSPASDGLSVFSKRT
jgi:N6-adenosine-specific RNA methylase IME4